MRKKLLNYSEQLTDQVLKDACERNSARIFAKTRIADVLPINNSGISDDLFSFALMAHFDFVIAGPELTALFVVEFDGPSHQDSTQRERDSKKDQLCDKFNLSILRINAEYINRKYRNLYLLSWFVEVWFAQRDFEKAQEEGSVPPDEPFDPMMFLHIPGLQGRFPLWLSAEPRTNLQILQQKGRCLDYVPAFEVGKTIQASSEEWDVFGSMILKEFKFLQGCAITNFQSRHSRRLRKLLLSRFTRRCRMFLMVVSGQFRLK